MQEGVRETMISHFAITDLLEVHSRFRLFTMLDPVGRTEVHWMDPRSLLLKHQRSGTTPSIVCR